MWVRLPPGQDKHFVSGGYKRFVFQSGEQGARARLLPWIEGCSIHPTGANFRKRRLAARTHP